MPDLSLQTAMVSYGHTKPLIDGTVNSDRVNLVHVPVSPIPTAFRRMVRGLEYDVSEMAMSTYLCALAHHKPITAFPAFVLRRFEHDEISYNTKSGIESPADLKGRFSVPPTESTPARLPGFCMAMNMWRNIKLPIMLFPLSRAVIWLRICCRGRLMRLFVPET